MISNTFELQASRSDTTKVLYVLRVRALRIDSREKFHGFKHACVKQNSFNKLNSKSGENYIRMAFSPPQDSPGAKPWGFPSALNLNPGVYRPSPKSAHAPKVPPRPPRNLSNLFDCPRATLICKNQYKMMFLIARGPF